MTILRYKLSPEIPDFALLYMFVFSSSLKILWKISTLESQTKGAYFYKYTSLLKYKSRNWMSLWNEGYVRTVILVQVTGGKG